MARPTAGASITPRLFLPALFFLAVGCGADGGDISLPPEDDASMTDNDATVTDVGPTPTFDIPVVDRFTPVDTGTDTGPRDTGNTPDTGPRDTGTDTGGSTGTCPSACAQSSDCNPCRASTDPPDFVYCCMSGICIPQTGMCMTTPPPPADGGMGDGGDDGGLGADGGFGDDASGDGGFGFDAD